MTCFIYVSMKIVQVIDFKLAMVVGILIFLIRTSLSDVLGKEIAECVYF